MVKLPQERNGLKEKLASLEVHFRGEYSRLDLEKLKFSRPLKGKDDQINTPPQGQIKSRGCDYETLKELRYSW